MLGWLRAPCGSVHFLQGCLVYLAISAGVVTGLHVPDPKLQLLERYGVMCGEHQRVPVLEAVPYVLRGLLLRYHKQLPLVVWRLICLQYIQEMS